MRRRVEDKKDSSSGMRRVHDEEEEDLVSPYNRMHPSYGSNPNLVNTDDNVDVDADADAEPMTPNQRPLHNDDLGSSNDKFFDANKNWSAKENSVIDDENVNIDTNGDEGVKSDKSSTARPSTNDCGASTCHSNREQSIIDVDEDGGEPEAEAEPNPIPPAPVEKQCIISCKMKKKVRYLPINVGLYRAALKGDWKTAKSIFDRYPQAVRMRINDTEETALHIAAGAKHIGFVEKLVKLMTLSDLTLKNDQRQTALHFAASSGVVRIAEVMVEKNPDLPNIHQRQDPTPVLMAVAYKRKDMASFLFSKTNFEDLVTSHQLCLLMASLEADYYDIALDILKKKPKLAIERRNETKETALHVLAKKTSAIGSSDHLSFWKRHINSRFKGFYNKALMQTLAHQIVETLWDAVLCDIPKEELSKFINKPSRLLDDAARAGNAEFLVILISSYPDLLWESGNDNKSIGHIAVENRQESVFSLIYEIGGLKDFIANNNYDEQKNLNMLHLAGKLAAPYHLNRVSGAALQMQRELLWFKEVEKLMNSSSREKRCSIPVDQLSNIEIRKDQSDKLTPRELFTKEHRKLLKDGEEWMKNTANSCMLVATLIATVVFAAAFTVPGGNDNNTGTPIFQNKDPFTVFVISDVAAFVSSTTSILTFLSILTSRYAEDDFLVSLPTKLLFGLLTLFVSIVCMVVAFSAAFFMVYEKAEVKAPLATVVVAIMPVSCFCVFHSKLVVDILRSLYGSKFSFRRSKRLF